MGGLWDFSVKPQSELDFWILDCFGFGIWFGLGGLDFGLGLDNKKIRTYSIAAQSNTYT